MRVSFDHCTVLVKRTVNVSEEASGVCLDLLDTETISSVCSCLTVDGQAGAERSDQAALREEAAIGLVLRVGEGEARRA